MLFNVRYYPINPRTPRRSVPAGSNVGGASGRDRLQSHQSLFAVVRFLDENVVR